MLLIAFLGVAAAVTLANVDTAPMSNVVGAVGANARGFRPLAQLAALLLMGGVYGLFRVSVRSREDLDTVLRALIVGAAFVGAFALYQVGAREFGLPYGFVNERRPVELVTSTDIVRVNSTLTEPSPLAQFMSIFVAIGLAWTLLRTRPAWLPRWAPPVLLLGGGLVLVATLSKAGLVANALLLPVLAVLCLRMRPRPPRGRAYAVAATALVVVFGGLLTIRAPNIFTSPGSVLASERYVREGYSLVAWDIMRDRPLGVGVGNYTFYFPVHDSVFSNYEYNDQVVDAHNWFLEAGAETGVLGGICFLGFVLLLIVRGLRAALRSADKALAASALALTISFAVGATMHLTYSYFYFPFEWVLAGLVGSLSSIVARTGMDADQPNLQRMNSAK
jgi:O-antigen ligase